MLESEEARVAIVEDQALEELYIERDTASKLVGNIYKGRVVSIEPSIQAAFVDFGIDKNGFLHISDVMPQYGGPANSDVEGPPEGKAVPDTVRVGQEMLVQVTKEEIGTKAPTLRTYISLPGRYLVLMPGVNKRGVSKKIEDVGQRRRLRSALNSIDPPRGMGYIVRTAGVDRTRNELARDLNYLVSLWNAIAKRARAVESPVEIYRESDLVLRAMRDIFTDRIEEVIVDSRDAYEAAVGFLREVMPAFAERVKLYEEPEPLFHRFNLEDQIERLYDRVVPLPSGGSIVIDQAEALVAIDVNSGKSKDNDNLEETALKTNLEAAREVCRQLKLRDMGGVICIDFIDMRGERNKALVENTVRELLAEDRARTRVARMSRFCILELTRQRVRMSIERTHYQRCPACGGTGSMKSVESMALWAMRQLRAKVARKRPSRPLEIRMHPEVSDYLNIKKRGALKDIETLAGQPLQIRPDKTLKVDDMRLR